MSISATSMTKYSQRKVDHSSRPITTSTHPGFQPLECFCLRPLAVQHIRQHDILQIKFHKNIVCWLFINFEITLRLIFVWSDFPSVSPSFSSLVLHSMPRSAICFNFFFAYLIVFKLFVIWVQANVVTSPNLSTRKPLRFVWYYFDCQRFVWYYFDLIGCFDLISRSLLEADHTTR